MTNTLETEIRKLFEDEGVELLELNVSGRANGPQVRVIGDRREGFLTIDDCVRLTREIQHVIGEKRLLAEDYRLEVSSPGLEYPLRENWQFQKNLGRLLKATVPGERGPKEISGRLTSVNTDGITLKSDKTEWTPRFADLISVRVLPEFKPPRSES
ncbi:MAG: ribosome maturation factor RimP [Calditrichota bacterium]